MYTALQLFAACLLSSLITAAMIETVHFLENRKKGKASK